MARQPNAIHEGAGQRQTLGAQEALNKIAALQNQLTEIQEEITQLANQGTALDNKIGNIQILSIVYVNADSPTFVAAGGQWTDVTTTIPAVSGATGYYFVPISSNYGAVSQITMNGREVTCIVRNVSGGNHTCRVRALAVAYKTV